MVTSLGTAGGPQQQRRSLQGTFDASESPIVCWNAPSHDGGGTWIGKYHGFFLSLITIFFFAETPLPRSLLVPLLLGTPVIIVPDCFAGHPDPIGDGLAELPPLELTAPGRCVARERFLSASIA